MNAASDALLVDASSVASCQKRWLPSAPTGTPPAPRCSHTATQLTAQNKHKFLVVGGGSCSDDGQWTHYGDVHEFDAHAETWTELVPASGSVLLPPRRGHCAGVYAKRALLYVFGGTSGDTGLGELRNDFWRMHLSGHTWEKLPTTGTTPPARRGGMSALSESLGQMWVFGGYVGVYPGFDQTMYRFDLVDETWHKEWSSGSPPFLALASCTLIETNGERPQLVVFGGSCYDPAQPRRDLSNDLWLCDLVSASGGVTWSRLETEGMAPSPRFSHGCAQFHDCVVIFGGTGRDKEHCNDESEPKSKTYADTHILDMRRPIPLWKEALELDSSVAPSARNGYTLVPCGADFVLFGGGVYGEAYYNDVHIFRLALQRKIAIPTDCRHRSVAEDLSALLWTNTTLADCLLQGQTEVDKGITAVIPMHRSILHARCPALRSRLAQAQAQLQPSASVPGQVIDQTLDARGPTVVVKVDSLFKAEHCQDGEEFDDARGSVVRRWPSALRSFACWVYTGSLWPPGSEWGCPADMDRPQYGQTRDAAHPHEHLSMVVMDRLVVLEKLSRPLCLPALATKCQAEAQAIHERMRLRLWKDQPSWIRRGIVPAPGTPAVGEQCEWAMDEYCRIECGASNFKLASKLKGTGNALFKQGRYDDAKAAYEKALERAATVAYTKQFGGWRECGSCVACASGTGSVDLCIQPAPSTDSKDAVTLWTVLLSNRAECWLRAGEIPDTSINTGAMAAAVLMDTQYGALGADPGHVKSRSRRERALAAIQAEVEAASDELASDLGSLLLSADDLSNISTAGDVVLTVGDSQLRAHRCILVARTDYFRNAFEGDFVEAKPGTNGAVEMTLDDVEPWVMRELLWCIYTGEPPEPTVEILAVAHRFGCDVVQFQCEELFAEAIDVEQVCDVLLLADHYGRHALREMAIAYIADHKEDVEVSEGWGRLSSALLEEIISASGSVATAS